LIKFKTTSEWRKGKSSCMEVILPSDHCAFQLE
jgi:hypothetical protein